MKVPSVSPVNTSPPAVESAALLLGYCACTLLLTSPVNGSATMMSDSLRSMCLKAAPNVFPFLKESGSSATSLQDDAEGMYSSLVLWLYDADQKLLPPDIDGHSFLVRSVGVMACPPE